MLVAGACQNPEAHPPLLLPGESPDTAIRLEFGGRSLLHPDGEGYETRPPADLSTYRPKDIRSPGWPLVRFNDGRLCIQTQNEFYFDLEAGLRLRICRSSTAARAKAIERVLAKIATIEIPTAYPVFDDDRLRIEVTRLVPLRKRTGKIEFSIDGDAHGRDLLRRAGLAGDRAYGAAIGHPNYLPRRFGAASFHLIVTGASAIFLYPLPGDDSRYLALWLREPGLAAALVRGLSHLPGILNRLNHNAPTRPALASEVFFAAQGGAGREWLELAGPDHDSRLRYALDDGRTRKTGEAFLFAYSALIFNEDNAPAFRDRIHAGDPDRPELISHADLLHRGAGRFRSLTRSANAPSPNASGGQTIDPRDFTAARNCWSGGAICGSPGLHPAIVARLQPPEDDGSAFCRAHDLRLTEWNPFGLVSENRADPAGKFVEFQARRPCRTGRLLLRAGETLLDPGFVNLAAGEVVLFAAAEEPLGLGEEIGFRRIHIDSELRGLAPEDLIVGLELEEDETAPGREIIFYRPDETIEFIPGERPAPRATASAAAASGFLLAKVHSLLPGEPLPLYHRAHTPGLRADLAIDHAMSPGWVDANSALNTNSTNTPIPPDDPQPGLGEVLPAGAYLNDTNESLPGEEFIEFIWPPVERSRDASFLLEITESSNASAAESTAVTIRRYLLPGPATRPRTVTRRLVWSRDEPRCWSRSPGWLRDDRLRLPNGPAEFVLRDEHGRLLDRLNIDAATHARLNRNGERRSLGLVAPSLWHPSGGSEGRDHACGERTLARPGLHPAHAPFFRRSSEQPPALRYHTMATFAQDVVWQAGHDINVPLATGTDRLLSGDTLSITLPAGIQGRVLIEATSLAAGAETFVDEIYPAGQRLYIQTIAPSPPAGGHEWLRICSGDAGYVQTSGEGLRIYDSRSSDELVSYGTRFATAPPLPLPVSAGPLHLAPHTCAILIDPDLDASTALYLPELQAGDRALWTVATSATLGNGLGSGEGLLLRREDNTGYTGDSAQSWPLASYGRPDTDAAFGLTTVRGEIVQRVTASEHGTIRRDTPEAWEVRQ